MSNQPARAANQPVSVTNWPSDYRPERTVIYSYNEIAIAAEPATVWAWLVRPKLWPTWYSNAKHVRLLSGPQPEISLGSVFRWFTFNAPIHTVVTEAVPYSRLAWRGSFLGSSGYHAWFIEPTATGCHVITEETQRGWIPSLGRWYVQPNLWKQHQRWLEGLARQAQAGLPPT